MGEEARLLGVEERAGHVKWGRCSLRGGLWSALETVTAQVGLRSGLFSGISVLHVSIQCLIYRLKNFANGNGVCVAPCSLLNMSRIS